MKFNMVFMSNLQLLILDTVIIPLIYRSSQGKTIYVAFINNTDCPNRFPFDGHPSTSIFLVIAMRLRTIIIQFTSRGIMVTKLGQQTHLLERGLGGTAPKMVVASLARSDVTLINTYISIFGRATVIKFWQQI